jgi:iron complex transport system ATP-binding protein
MVNDSGVTAGCYFELDHATVWRGENRVFRDFSLQLHLGESVVILGPNGAGKSTLIQLLTGGLRPEAGPDTRCVLFGEEFYAIADLRHRIGMVLPEDLLRLAPEETAIDVVLSSFRGAYGRTREMRFSRTERIRAGEVLERLGVAALARREFGRLSSGEKQRILLARALVHDPPVLVLDEPSAALDFAAAAGFTLLMRDLIRSGHTLVLVTHHPAEIPPEIQRAILLDRGAVFAEGPKRRILTSKALSELYQTPLRVGWPGGWCDVRPVSPSGPATAGQPYRASDGLWTNKEAFSIPRGSITGMPVK